MPSLLFLLPYCAYAPHPTSVTAPALPLWPNPAVAHQARGTGPWLPLLPYMFSTPSVTAVDRHEVYLRRYESPAATTTINDALYTLPHDFQQPASFYLYNSISKHILHHQYLFHYDYSSVAATRAHSTILYLDPEVAERCLAPHTSTIINSSHFFKSPLQSTRISQLRSLHNLDTLFQPTRAPDTSLRVHKEGKRNKLTVCF